MLYIFNMHQFENFVKGWFRNIVNFKKDSQNKKKFSLIGCWEKSQVSIICWQKNDEFCQTVGIKSANSVNLFFFFMNFYKWISLKNHRKKKKILSVGYRNYC